MIQELTVLPCNCHFGSQMSLVCPMMVISPVFLITPKEEEYDFPNREFFDLEKLRVEKFRWLEINENQILVYCFKCSNFIFKETVMLL